MSKKHYEAPLTELTTMSVERLLNTVSGATAGEETIKIDDTPTDAEGGAKPHDIWQ